jgi:KUP system potassium uptake protein
MAESQHTSSNGAAHGDVDPQFASEKMKPKRLQRFDSLHMEAGKIPGVSTHAAKVCSPVTLLQLDNDPSIA